MDWFRAADVEKAMEDMLTGLRARLLSIPGAASSAANPEDPARAEREVMRHLNDALADISGGAIAEDAQRRRQAREERRKRIGR